MILIVWLLSMSFVKKMKIHMSSKSQTVRLVQNMSYLPVSVKDQSKSFLQMMSLTVCCQFDQLAQHKNCLMEPELERTACFHKWTEREVVEEQHKKIH